MVIALILALSILPAVELNLVKSASANGYVLGMMPRTYIHSPENKTYTTNSIPVDVSFEISQRVYDNSSNPTITVQLDNAGYKKDGWFRIAAECVSGNETWVIFRGQTTLENLSDGKHEVRFACSASNLGSIYDMVAVFTVEAHTPTVTVLSPENKTYDTNRVSLNFTLNEDVPYVKYSLDGTENVTTAGNNTLTDLPNGQHCVTIYATDQAGNVGASKTISFTVAVPGLFAEPEQEPFPTLLVVVFSVAVAVVFVVVALVYLKEHRSLPQTWSRILDWCSVKKTDKKALVVPQIAENGDNFEQTLFSASVIFAVK